MKWSTLYFSCTVWPLGCPRLWRITKNSLHNEGINEWVNSVSIFLIATTSKYLWSSAVCKHQSFFYEQSLYVPSLCKEFFVMRHNIGHPITDVLVNLYPALQRVSRILISLIYDFFFTNFSDSLRIWPMLSQRLLEPLRPRLHFLSPWTYLKRKMEWIKEYLGKTFEVVLYIVYWQF